MTPHDTISRRHVLQSIALATTSIPLVGSAVNPAAGATQEGDTFMAAFAGGSPLAVARGDTFVDVHGPQRLPVLSDAVIEGPESVLAFVPQRLASEEGLVGLEAMLMMTSARALEGDIADVMPAFDGVIFEGPEWMSAQIADAISEKVFDLPPAEAIHPVAFDVPLSSHFPDGYGGPEPTEGIEAGTPLGEVAVADPGEDLAFSAPGPTFFTDEVAAEFEPTSWEELAAAGTAFTPGDFTT